MSKSSFKVWNRYKITTVCRSLLVVYCCIGDRRTVAVMYTFCHMSIFKYFIFQKGEYFVHHDIRNLITLGSKLQTCEFISDLYAISLFCCFSMDYDHLCCISSSLLTRLTTSIDLLKGLVHIVSQFLQCAIILLMAMSLFNASCDLYRTVFIRSSSKDSIFIQSE